MLTKRALLVAFLIGFLPIGAARGDSNLFVGVSDDGLKWMPAESVAVARDLGMKAFRIALGWKPGQTDMSASDISDFDRAVVAASGMRIVVAIYGHADHAPLDDAERDEYCTYVRSMLTRYPLINDVVIWNEPNLSYFWRPQFAGMASVAPAAYEALLARCWDALHAFRSSVNVISNTSPRGSDRPWAVSNVSHSPGNFIRQMGKAYRASGRTQPIFDTVGHHAYGYSAERPWTRHPGTTQISEGDWDKLMDALREAYAGTAQSIPGECGGGSRCVSIWYLEAGYQTVPDQAKRPLYVGSENDSHPVVDFARGGTGAAAGGATDNLAPDQRTQIIDGVRLAYCQRYVTAFFNFLLRDEPDLGRWQSAPLWVDGTRKDSYFGFKQVIGEVNARSVDCSTVGRAEVPARSEPKPRAIVNTVEWPRAKSYGWQNTVWQFRLKPDDGASYVASLYRVGGGTESASPARTSVLTVHAEAKRGAVAVVRFPAVRLEPGPYEMEVVLFGKSLTPARTFTSLRFLVKPRPGSPAPRRR